MTGGVPLDGIAATITANSTHWFSCYIRVLESVGSVITSAIRECRSIEAIPVGWPESIDFEHPINDTINDRMYSCMINDTNMILAVSNSQTQQYTLYSLDTTSYFAVTGRANAQGNQTVRSITCMDQVILVATQSSIDYWVWDNGVSLTQSYSTIVTLRCNTTAFIRMVSYFPRHLRVLIQLL